MTRVSRLQLLKAAEVAATDVAFIGHDAARRNRGASGRGRRIRLLIACRISSACSWSTQKTMVLANRSVFRRKSVRLLAMASVRARRATILLEIRRLVFLVGDRAAVAVQFVLGGTPTGRIHVGHDAMDAVWRKEAVLDALPQAVGVDRLPK